MVQAVTNAFRLPDLRRRILFTLAILVIYRFLAHIPVPGVDLNQLRSIFDAGSQFGSLFNMLDLFSGGAMSNFSILSFGVYPYITASIIMQLLQPIIPQLEALAKEGDAGKQKMNLYMHLLTIPLAALQAYTQAILFSNQGVFTNIRFGIGNDTLVTIAIVASMTAGTMLAVWLGELITESGIGNGISIIIFGGIVANAPQNLRGLVANNNFGALFIFIAIEVITVAGIVLIQEGQRRIPVQYAKRIRGNRMYGGQSTHIPLRVNSAGMIPLIFASSLLLFPAVIAQFFLPAPGVTPGIGQQVAQAIYNAFNSAGPIYWAAYFILVVGFTYFYTAVTFQQQNLPENLQKFGGFIPGIRPGRPTQEYLNRVLNRITLVGALFLGTVAVMPFFLKPISGSSSLIFSSTGILIVVGVVLDTMRQLEAQLSMRHYEGFIK
jgi:preprotein translocase subunit SecY